jgi:hypothetical protein
LLANISQDDVLVALVLVSTELAIKGLVNFAAILNLSVFVVFAEESLRVIRESLNFIKNFLIAFDFFRPRTEFLESVHWVIIWVIS